MESRTVIEVENLTKDFHSESGDIVHALSGVSFSVKEGEFLAVEGPSGGGKSTLLAILGLLDKPSSGTYRLSGISVNELSFSQQAQLRNEAIGFVFQSFNLIGHLNVLKNVIVPLEYSRQIPKSITSNWHSLCSKRLGWQTERSTCHTSFPAGSSSELLLRERLSLPPRSCLRTSQREILIHATLMR